MGFIFLLSPPCSMNIIYDFDSFLKSPTRSANSVYLDAFQNFVNELIIHTLIVFDSDEFF